MRILFVVNPRAARVSFAEARRTLRAEFKGHDVVFAGAMEPDPPDSDRPERRHGDGAGTSGQPPDLVVAVGGDGTVHQVINALVGRNIPLGILPRGRANDFARNLGIPLRSRAACRLIHRPAVAYVDLVSVNGRIIGTSGGIGLIGAVSARAASWRRGSGPGSWIAARLGAGCYPLAVIIELLAGTGTDRERLSLEGRGVEVAAVVVSNQPRLGRWFSVTSPASDPRGGFGLCVIDAPPSRRSLLMIAARAAATGLHRQPGVSIRVVRHCTLRFDEDVDFFGDGEFLMRGRRFEIRALSRILPVVVHPASPLLDAA